MNLSVGAKDILFMIHKLNWILKILKIQMLKLKVIIKENIINISMQRNCMKKLKMYQKWH